MYKANMVFCSVILTLVTLIASQATSTNYCSVMCQGKNSSTVCQNFVADYKPERYRPKMNYICCFTNEFIPSHYDYFKEVTVLFKLAIMQEQNQEILNEYAECVRRCGKPGGKRLTFLDCDKHTKSKYSKCDRKTCGL